MCEQPSEPPSKHKQNPIKDSNSNPYKLDQNVTCFFKINQSQSTT